MVRRGIFGVALVVHLVALYTPKSPPLPSSVIGVDKLVHIALFAVVLYTGVRAGLPLRLLVPALLANAVVSELAQYLFLARRSGDVWDAVADAIGVGLAYLVLRRLDRDRPGRPVVVREPT